MIKINDKLIATGILFSFITIFALILTDVYPSNWMEFCHATCCVITSSFLLRGTYKTEEQILYWVGWVWLGLGVYNYTYLFM